MQEIKISMATKKDIGQLLGFFKHYKARDIIKKRVNCYLSHNFTVVAKDKNVIVGILQWYVKEDPGMGVAEFEEFYVLDNYRGKGVGSSLVSHAIRSVKKHFIKNRIKPRRIFVFTGEKNKAVRNILKKHGFKVISGVGNLFFDNKKEAFCCLVLS